MENIDHENCNSLNTLINIDQNQVLFSIKNECCHNVVEMFSYNVLLHFFTLGAIYEKLVIIFFPCYKFVCSVMRSYCPEIFVHLGWM